MNSTPPADRLAQLVIQRRRDLGMKKAVDLADSSTLSPRLISDIENGKRDNWSDATKDAIERALEWNPGSIDNILAGGEPEVRGPEKESPTSLDTWDAGPHTKLQLHDLLDYLGIVMKLAERASPIAGHPGLHSLAEATRSGTGNLVMKVIAGATPGSANDALPEALDLMARAFNRDPSSLRTLSSLARVVDGSYPSQKENFNDLEAASQPSAPPEGDQNEEAYDPKHVPVTQARLATERRDVTEKSTPSRRRARK